MQTKITLGYLGFLPFAALTILPWILGETYEEISFQLLVVYGGIIISFLSGIIWGIDSTNRKNLVLAIIFSLMGFGAILLAWINLIYAMTLLFFLFLSIFPGGSIWSSSEITRSLPGKIKNYEKQEMHEKQSKNRLKSRNQQKNKRKCRNY